MLSIRCLLSRSAQAVLLFGASTGTALALGECGLACCLAGAATSGVTLAQNFGLSLQYEHSNMETILHGDDEVSPNEVIDAHWSAGSSYRVPTDMVMKKLSLIGALPLSARWQLLGIVPYVENDMDMRMKNPMGMTMDMSMDTVDGLGDITAMAFYTALTDAPVRPTERLTLGFGIKMPTGENDVRSANGALVHAMMQPGSGSWDPVFTVNYMRAWYPLVVQLNGYYHLTTEGDEGYEFGDQLGADIITRYQVAPYVNLGLDLNAIMTEQDDDHDGKYSQPATSMIDNVDYTGLTSVLVAASIQFKFPDTGGSAELKYQVPVYQDVEGYQQVLDNRILASVSWAF
jgi:hypothetical protein